MSIASSKRLVIKIGSSLLVNSSGILNNTWLSSLVEDIAYLKKCGKDVVVVSSGSVALGKDALGIEGWQLKISEKQAAAACGQLSLLNAYSECLKNHKISAAQILLTIEDSDDRRRYLNAKNTINTLLEADIVPVINENDTVATDEIRFGDNDRLAARVAQMISADCLVLLSDVDGLYDSNPVSNDTAKYIPVVEEITGKIEKMADGAISDIGSGGMITKIAAAKIASSSGCCTIISLGSYNRPLKFLIDGGKHTLFTANEAPVSARKRWIAHSLNISGEVTIDDGAVNALMLGNSLLPAGATGISGNFGRGDAISILNSECKEIARGLANHSSFDALRIIGLKTHKIESIIGCAGRDELVHRDDMVLL